VETPKGRLTRDKGLGAAVVRYGNLRSFTLRTLYSWLTLTILLTFSWPAMIVYLDAPTGVSPRATPLGWFVARLLAAALSAAAAGLLWRLSPIPATVAQPERARRLFSRASGRVWPQALVFLCGLSALLLVLLLVADPLGALQVALLGLAEALAVQLLLSGYVKGLFDLTLDDYRATVATLGLFALTYGMREGLDAASGSGDFVLALVAGGVLGLLIGGVSLWLRAKSGSLLPALLAQWLLLYILVGLFES
jgi:hypothetical protein